MRIQTAAQFIREHVDNPVVHRARIDRLLSSGAALADLVTAEEAAEIRRVCAECKVAADDAEAADDKLAAYVAMEPEVDLLADWMASMVKGLDSGIYDAKQACRAALRAAGGAEDEYAYRELGSAAQRAAEAFASACEYAVALYVNHRTSAYHWCQDLVVDCVETWKKADKGLGTRVLFYRKDAYAAGTDAVWAAQSCIQEANSKLGKASSADNTRRAFANRERG